jgi:hypothetical protein
MPLWPFTGVKCRDLARPGIALAQPHAVPLGQPHQAFARPVEQPCIGGNITFLGSTVVSMITSQSSDGFTATVFTAIDKLS